MAATVFEPLVKCFTLAPHWLTSDVVDVARGIFEDGAFERAPILADALMDAGCEDVQIIGACRNNEGKLTWQLYLVLFLIMNRGPWNTTQIWKVYVPKGVTPRIALDALVNLGGQEEFTVYSFFPDLEERMIHHDRSADRSWMVEVLANVRANEGYFISTENLWRRKIQGLTFAERILLEILFFAHVNDHLDKDIYDRTIGSRRDDGMVPYVRYNLIGYVGIHIGQYIPEASEENLRMRIVLSVV